MNPQILENRLHTQIPLSKFMQVQVTKVDDKEVELQCILEPNHNHMGTAFGGSLSCLMILAAYCQTFKLIQANGHVVLKSSSMKFMIPVEETLRAVCKSPSPEDIQSFTNAFSKKGRARIQLESQIILKNGQIACTLTGEFVGIADANP